MQQQLASSGCRTRLYGSKQRYVRCFASAWLIVMLGTVILGGLVVSASGSEGEKQLTKATLLSPSRSSTIALTQDNRRLVVVNRETNSLSVIRVRNLAGRDVAEKLAEIAVGTEPRCVALHPNGLEAYVTNAVSGTVSVVNLIRFHVEVDVAVGVEPRGCAITPNGAFLFIANHTEGSVGVIDTASRTYLGALSIGGNPTAIAITNNGDTNDIDETAFVTQFYAELDPWRPRGRV